MIADRPPNTTSAAANSDALFREARRRQRRRWTIRAVGALVILGCAGAVALMSESARYPAGVVRSDRSAAALPTGALVPLRTAGPLAVGLNGALYVADIGSDRVLVRVSGRRFRVIAGTGTAGYSGDDGPATRAELSNVTDMTVSPTGSLYLADGGRIRTIDRAGVIRTIAGNGRSAQTIANGTPALLAALGSSRSVAAGQTELSIAFSPTGELYIATSSQLLRLTPTGTLATVPTQIASGPAFLRGRPLRNLGPIAVDAHGNIDVAGVNGYSIWQVTPTGAAHQIGGGTGAARRSGGADSELERAPDGTVYGERQLNSQLLRIHAHALVPAFAFTTPLAGEDFWLTYFAFGPHGTLYADEIPGGSAFERYQQLVSVSDGHETLLWEQPAKPTR